MSAKPIDLSSHLGKCRNRIARIGIELEGGWLTLPKGCQNGVEHDGSVVFPAPNTAAETLKAPRHIGEIPSPRLSPVEVKKDSNLIYWQTWLKQFYPSHVNQTCGMHVHMSFENNLMYQRLYVEEYGLTVVEEFKRWSKTNLPKDHCIHDRLAGKSEYCQLLFIPEQALINRKLYDRKAPVHRYTAISYCWNRTRTVECRLLPMMPDIDRAIAAITHLLRITNAFLVKTAKREEHLSIDLALDLAPSMEEFHESI